MDSRETLANVKRVGKCYRWRWSAGSPDQRRQVLSVDELHGQEGRIMIEPDIVDPANIRVGDLNADPCLIGYRGAAQSTRWELKRYSFLEAAIFGAPDLTAASLSHSIDNPVSTGHDEARREERRSLSHRLGVEMNKTFWCWTDRAKIHALWDYSAANKTSRRPAICLDFIR